MAQIGPSISVPISKPSIKKFHQRPWILDTAKWRRTVYGGLVKTSELPKAFFFLLPFIYFINWQIPGTRACTCVTKFKYILWPNTRSWCHSLDVLVFLDVSEWVSQSVWHSYSLASVVPASSKIMQNYTRCKIMQTCSKWKMVQGEKLKVWQCESLKWERVHQSASVSIS